MADGQVSTEAAEVLRGRILDGRLAPGTKLAGERMLSEELGISRTALRDALQTLEATGFVEVRSGRGRYVSSTEGRGSVAAMDWLVLHRNDLESLNEVRELLEPRAVSTIPLDKLADLAARADAVVGQQVRAIASGQLHVAADLDGDFHSVLISATPNAPLREMTEQLIGMARIHATRVYGVPGVASHSVAQHEDIVAALQAGDLGAAARLVHEHAHTAYRLAFSESSGSAPA